MKREQFPEGSQEILDSILQDFLVRESTLGNALLAQGASQDQIDHMFQTHFWDLCGDLFGDRWVHQLRYGNTRNFHP